MPIDSLAKLMGHNDLQTTQRYIDGADLTVRDDFLTTMEKVVKVHSRKEHLPRYLKEMSSNVWKKSCLRQQARRVMGIYSTVSGFTSWLMAAYGAAKCLICVLGIATSVTSVCAFVQEKGTVTG